MSPSASALAKSGRDEWSDLVTGAADARLVELLSIRPDLLLAGVVDLPDLALALVEPRQVRIFYESSDRTTRHVLEALCVLSPPAKAQELADLLGAEPAALEPVLHRLELGGLVLRRGDLLTRNPGLPGAIPRAAALGPSIIEALSALPLATLTTIGQRIGADTKGAKAAVVESMVAVLSSPEQVATLVARGPEGTEPVARRMAREYLDLHLGYSNYQTIQSDHSPVGYLWRRALLVATAYGTATMPAQVALALRGGRLFDAFSAEGPTVATKAVGTDQVDRDAAEAALRLVADVAVVLEAWSVVPAKLLQAGGLGVREVRRVAKLTGRSEADAARLVELASSAGLADVHGDAAVPTTDYDQWLDRPMGSRWARLARSWWETPIHLSLAGAIDVRGKPIPPLLDRRLEPNALSRKKAVLGAVGAAPPGYGVDPAGVAAQVDWDAPMLWRGGPARAERLVSWIWSEAELLGVMAAGTLSSFGRHLLEDDDDAASAVLGEHAPPVMAEAVLQADLTAVVAGELAPGLRRELDLLADVESTGAATVYRFSETSLRRGFDAGRRSGDILAFLSERAARGVPQPLAYLVADLDRRFGQVRVGAAACYVRADDPALVAEVVRAKKVARLGLRLLAPTVAVSDADPSTVEHVLRDAGYLAATEDHDGALVLRRPPARRAPATGGPGSLGRLTRIGQDTLAGLLDDPELLAEVTGMPAEAVMSSLVEQLRRLGVRPDGADPATGGPIDLAAVVERWRHPRRRPVGSVPPSAPPPPPPHRSDGFTELHLFDGRSARPTHIVSDLDSVTELLEDAFAEAWLVRVSYLTGAGAESEFYAEVTDVRRQSVKVRHVPSGTGQELQIRRIRWARVATEAEEEAHFQ